MPLENEIHSSRELIYLGHQSVLEPQNTMESNLNKLSKIELNRHCNINLYFKKNI